MNNQLNYNELSLLEGDVLKNIDFTKFTGKKDLYSELFEKIKNKEQREKFSQFFTHKELVNFIISNVPINKNSTILDPACGAGAFLYEVYSKNKNLKNLYGIDIDALALDLCKINLQGNKDHLPHLKLADTLKQKSLNNIFPEIAKNGGFDIIIGNPPFKNLIKNIDYKLSDYSYPDAVSGVTNSATLMIIKSYEFLKEDGYLAFVLPKNLIRVDSFYSLRQFLIQNTTLIKIFDIDHYFKDVRGDQIILIVKKHKLNKTELENHKIKIYIKKKNDSFETPYEYELSQKEFRDYLFFPLFYDQEVNKVYKKLMQSSETLSSISIDIFRGLNINPNNPFISKLPKKSSIKIYRGDSIKRFGIKYPLYLNSSLKDLDEFKINRLKKDKIILQNIFSKEGGICATISNKEELTLDTVTNIIPKKGIDPLFLLGVINSKLSNFFMIFVIYLHSNFAMHTDKKYIGQIPIVIPSKLQEEKVINLVKKLMSLDNKYSKEFRQTYDEMNDIIFEIYKISIAEKKVIIKLLTEVMSVKQNGRTNE